MSFPRLVEPEILDGMVPTDPRAARARRDLRRVNAIMGHRRIWKRILREFASGGAVCPTILELGAGDGTLLLEAARSLGMPWLRVRVLLLDRQLAVSPRTLEGFAELGWEAAVIQADALEFAAGMPFADLVVANLFLHHFDEGQLAGLFRCLAARAHTFAACEPRRARFPLLGSRLLGLAGCGPVARYDAVVSVCAGFADGELSALWSGEGDWQLLERRAGLFSHVFVARRRAAAVVPS